MTEVVYCAECGSDDPIVYPECQQVMTEFCPNCLSPDDLKYLSRLECFMCYKRVCPKCGPEYGRWERSLARLIAGQLPAATSQQSPEHGDLAAVVGGDEKTRHQGLRYAVGGLSRKGRLHALTAARRRADPWAA